MDGERPITEWIARRARRGRGVALGIGDDCAIYRPQAGEELVFTTDFLIEGVHFRREHTLEAAGEKALARGLSDIAAMGAEPRFALVSLAAPSDAAVRRFYRGLLRWNVPVAGGDLSRLDRVICDVVVCGSVPRGEALRRDGARPGDRIYVSGPLGGFAAGGYSIPPVPRPRLDAGLRLRGRATACMDISDGLALDLHRLCLASGVAAEIDRVPQAEGATREHVLYGGEDYELLYTGPPGLEGIEIGRIVAGEPGRTPFPARGWDHFTYNRRR